MGPMPLTEVKFIRTFLRDEPVDMTVEEVLKHATDPDFRLNLDVSGMEFMSIIRLLSHIGARMLQKDDSLHRKEAVARWAYCGNPGGAGSGSAALWW